MARRDYGKQSIIKECLFEILPIVCSDPSHSLNTTPVNSVMGFRARICILVLRRSFRATNSLFSSCLFRVPNREKSLAARFRLDGGLSDLIRLNSNCNPFDSHIVGQFIWHSMKARLENPSDSVKSFQTVKGATQTSSAQERQE